MKYIYFFLLFLSSICFSENSEFSKYIKYNENEKNLIGYIYIGKEHPIDQSTYIYVKLAIDEFKEKKVDFIVLHLNTPGGEVFAAQEISSLLYKCDAQYNIPVVAWIDNWAISAGAMLAYSCRFIGITDSASMGAAEPVMMKQEQMHEAPEKIKSALRSEFANLARLYGRNPYVAEAMVDKDIILVKRKNEIIKLSSENEIRRTDQVISEKGKLLTLDSEMMQQLNISNFVVKTSALSPITKEELRNGVWPADKLLMFKDSFFSKMKNAYLISYKDWRIKLFYILSHPAVMSILTAAMLICFYIEINTPGFGVFGSLGLLFLSAVLLSQFVLYTISWLEVILLLIGILLLLLELFVIPGFGIVGILGIILMLIGFSTLLVPNIKDISFSFDFSNLNISFYNAFHKMKWIFSSFILAIIIMFLLSKYILPKFSFYKKLIHQGEQKGYKAHKHIKINLKKNMKGLAYTNLRPFGKVVINNEYYNAVSEKGFIEKGKKIIIVSIEKNQLVVKKQ